MKIPDNIVQHTEVTVTKGNSISTSVSEVVDINRISTFKKLLRLTSFLYFIVEKCTFRGIVHCLSVEKLKRVEQFGLKRIFHMMLRFRCLEPQSTSNGTITVVQRMNNMNNWIENN